MCNTQTCGGSTDGADRAAQPRQVEQLEGFHLEGDRGGKRCDEVVQERFVAVLERRVDPALRRVERVRRDVDALDDLLRAHVRPQMLRQLRAHRGRGDRQTGARAWVMA